MRAQVNWGVRIAAGDWGTMTPAERAAAGSSTEFVRATATTYGEDALERLTTIEQTFEAAADLLWAAGVRPTDRSVKFSYNGDGARALIQRYDAPTVTGTSIADTTFGYDGSGRLASMVHSHGATELAATIISQYSAAGRIVKRETRRNVTGQANLADKAVVRETYFYDPGGQITNVAVQTGAALAALATTNTDSYHYDDSGNRVLDDTGAVDVGADNRLAEDARFTYQYDRHGRLTERASRDGKVREIFAWDDRGLLLSVTRKETQGAVTHETQLVEYAYDAAGRRTGRRTSTAAMFGDPLTVTEVSITQYDGTSRLAEFDANGQIVRHYLNGPGPNEVLAVDQGGETAWAFTDQLGSVTTWGSYNAATATWTLEHVAFDAFGNRDATLSSATPLPVGGQPLPQLWAGHQFESELNLYHMQARWYDPHSGRFLSPDPLSYAAGDNNLYRYAGNAVTTSTDPLGLYELGTANTSAGNCNNFPRPRFTGPRCTGEWPKTPKTSHPLDWGAVREGIAEIATDLWGPFEVVGGIAFEPFDWFVTAKEIYKDPRNLWNYAGLLPIIPGAIGRYGDEAAELTGQVRHEISRKVARALDERPNLHAPSSSHVGSGVYAVGLAKDLRRNPLADTHVNHAPQSRHAESLIGEFNTVNKVGHEPAIRLPISEHEAVTAAQALRRVPASARELLADEIRILRNNTNAPNSKLRELIDLSNNTHPYDYAPLHRTR